MITSINNSPEHQNQEVIQSWHTRARAYDNLIRRWPIFTRMADRLIDQFPADGDFNGRVLDIGGGSGLVTDRFLQRHPQAQVTLIDPAEEMCRLAESRFGGRVKVENMAGDQIDSLRLSADGALCSAAFHLMDEQTTLPSIAAVLKLGSIFAFNLWGHSFDKTASLDQRVDWSLFVNQALQEYKEPLLSQDLAKNGQRRPRSLETLIEIGESCGLQFQQQEIIKEIVDAKFHIEFVAMDPRWLGDIEPQKRDQIIRRALKLAKGVSTVYRVDLCFVKQ